MRLSCYTYVRDMVTAHNICMGAARCVWMRDSTMDMYMDVFAAHNGLHWRPAASVCGCVIVLGTYAICL